jgi:Flp pilus assembly protein CpaB
MSINKRMVRVVRISISLAAVVGIVVSLFMIFVNLSNKPQSTSHLCEGASSERSTNGQVVILEADLECMLHDNKELKNWNDKSIALGLLATAFGIILFINIIIQYNPRNKH